MKPDYLKNTHFHHVALSVRDMNRALEFYRDLLGFELEM
jgi:catechol 2,3-dioxygenase-like lactoylglutathione lyase family enzyme